MTILHTVVMLSVAKIITPDSSYYTFPTESSRGANPYYEQDGVWEGRLQHLLPVADTKVFKNDLDAIWSGKTVDTQGIPIKSHGKIKNIAFDFTFSTPKSVSLFYALAKDDIPSIVEKCHLKAVRKSFGYLESQASFVRGYKDGIQEVLPSQGLLAAHFLHRVSRSNDPHLHSHLTIANLSPGITGKWTALYTMELYSHIHNACLIYHWDLRFQLTKSLGIEFQNSTPYADAVGFTKKTIDTFSKRNRQITEGLLTTGYTSYKAKQIAIYATRPEKTFSVSYSDLQERWTKEAYEIGFSPNKLHSLLHKNTYLSILKEKNTSKGGSGIDEHITQNENLSMSGKVSKANISENIDSPHNLSSTEEYIKTNILLLSCLKVTFTRKELLGMCLNYVNDQLSVEELDRSIDKALGSEDILTITPLTNRYHDTKMVSATNGFTNIRNSSLEEKNIEGSRSIRHDIISPSGKPPDGLDTQNQEYKKNPFMYMHRRNYEMLQKIDSDGYSTLRSGYFEKLRQQIDPFTSPSAKIWKNGAEELETTKSRIDKATYLDSSVNALPDRGREAKESLLVLTKQKRRADTLQNITGEETLTFQEVVQNALYKSQSYDALANLIGKKSAYQSNNTYRKPKITIESINEMESSITNYLVNELKNKKVLYELSNNSLPIVLRSLMKSVDSSESIEFTDPQALSEVIRSKSGISTTRKHISPERSEMVDSYKKEETPLVYSDASFPIFSADAHDKKMRILLLEETHESFLATLQSYIQLTLVDSYKNIVIVADDSLDIKPSDIINQRTPYLTKNHLGKQDKDQHISVTNWKKIADSHVSGEEVCIVALGFPTKTIDRQKIKNCTYVMQKPKFISSHELRPYLDSMTTERRQFLYGKSSGIKITASQDRSPSQEYLRHQNTAHKSKNNFYNVDSTKKKTLDSKEKTYKLREPPGLSL